MKDLTRLGGNLKRDLKKSFYLKTNPLLWEESKPCQVARGLLLSDWFASVTYFNVCKYISDYLRQRKKLSEISSN